MIETIYIARHGFRSNWVDSNWKSVTGLSRDPPLAAYGEAQALELAKYIQSLPKDKQPTAIFSSPYYRCLQTSRPVAEHLSLPIYIDHGLSEWYSTALPGTGLLPRPKGATDLQSLFPEINASWSSIWLPSRKGEDVEELHARVAGFLDHFIHHVERRTDINHKNILFVSHAATIIALCRGLLAQPDLPLRVGCCTLSQLSRKLDADGASQWDAISLASSAHLSDQETLRDWGFEDIQTHGNGKVIHDAGVPGTEGEEDDTFGPQIHLSML
ncbi:histidine phosphatase superfamily [Melanogaster broomeanus]|nr:histidine phosphatase superfamily [Melanogaster broomeanus]